MTEQQQIREAFAKFWAELDHSETDPNRKYGRVISFKAFEWGWKHAPELIKPNRNRSH